MATCSSASEAAKAVNKILRFDTEEDQEALLEVLDSYFYPPNNRPDSEADEDMETSMEERGVIH